MNLLAHTTTWVKGEVSQGKIMLGLGALILAIVIGFFMSDLAFLQGMLIPLGLIFLFLTGYGSMQVFVRPKHIPKVKTLFEADAAAALDQELTKALKDHKTYSMLQKFVWPALMLIAVGLYFFFSEAYYKGLSIGLLALFTTGLSLDTVLHNRLKIYLKALQGHS